MNALAYLICLGTLLGNIDESHMIMASPPDTIPTTVSTDLLRSDTLPAPTPANIPAALTVNDETERPQRIWTIKTNIVPWIGTIMNIEGEVQLWHNLSLSIPIWYCPWFITERHALRVAAMQPEVRWWLKQPGRGHFGGIHGSLAWYNLKWGDFRYQDRKRPLLGIGLSYGYAFTLCGQLGMELSAGVGYLNLYYDRFYNTFNGQLADTRQTSYFGIDHLSISLVYNFSY